MRILLGCLVLVAACNQLLEHEQAEQVNSLSDRDQDGVLDERDNCPDVANPEQSDVDGDRLGDVCDGCPEHRPTRDRDGDGVDDACDTCLSGPELDDDGDGVMDGCDLCPISFASEQLDTDGDLVGDACDLLDAAFNTRILVDTFASLEPTRWSGLESFSHDASATSIRPTRPDAILGWTAGAVSALSVAFTSDDTGVLRVVFADTIVSNAACELRCTQGTCALELFTDSSTTTPVNLAFPDGRGVLRLYKVPPPLTGPAPLFSTFSCDLVGESTPITGTVQEEVFRTQLTIHATPGIRIDGVDLVQ